MISLRIIRWLYLDRPQFLVLESKFSERFPKIRKRFRGIPNVLRAFKKVFRAFSNVFRHSRRQMYCQLFRHGNCQRTIPIVSCVIMSWHN